MKSNDFDRAVEALVLMPELTGETRNKGTTKISKTFTHRDLGIEIVLTIESQNPNLAILNFSPIRGFQDNKDWQTHQIDKIIKAVRLALRTGVTLQPRCTNEICRTATLIYEKMHESVNG